MRYSFQFTIDFILLGSILLAFTTRTWVTSLSTALMITICHSHQLARRCFWIYHLFGWIVPICISLIIYVFSSPNPLKSTTLGAEKFGRIQIIFSIILLALCILINIINLLRITRRTYQLRQNSIDNGINDYTNDLNSNNNEIQSLMNDDEQIDSVQYDRRGNSINLFV